MKPIREAEAKIFTDGGIGFEYRWQALPFEIRLNSLVASMNEFVSVRAKCRSALEVSFALCCNAQIINGIDGPLACVHGSPPPPHLAPPAPPPPRPRVSQAQFIRNLLLEGADPRSPRPGPVAVDLLPELFALDVRTMAATDHLIHVFKSAPRARARAPCA